MPAMIGIVMLMGLVTKNAILLVDLTNQLRARGGLSVRDAILKAGPVRLRPILMTTIAMILGMLPSAMGGGEGGEFRAPISIATIGGLITSTLLTLVVVPVAYLLLARTLERVKAWRASGARVPQAVRVTGVIVLIAVLGWLSATALAHSPNRPNPPSDADVRPGARARAGGNEGLKVAKERVVETQARVQEAKTNFLPQVNLGYNFTPSQRFPVIGFRRACSDPRSRRSRPASRSVISSSCSSTSRSTPAAG